MRLLAYAAMAASLWGGATTLPAAAQSIEVNEESVNRQLDLAGRQRMLAQRMAKQFCYARSGVEVMENVDELRKAHDLFARTHRGLVHGDDEQGLFEEGDASVVATWGDVDMIWAMADRTYADMLSGEVVSPEDFGNTMKLSSELVSRANDLVSQIRTVYGEHMGDVGHGGALLVDLYGRQRMLSQKLSKEVCLAAYRHDVDATRAELDATIKVFDNSINAFIDGLAIAGIPQAPTPEIEAQLRLARDIWVPVRPTAVSVARGRATSLSELGAFNREMDRFLVEMNKAVGMLASHQSAQPGA